MRPNRKAIAIAAVAAGTLTLAGVVATSGPAQGTGAAAATVLDAAGAPAGTIVAVTDALAGAKGEIVEVPGDA